MIGKYIKDANINFLASLSEHVLNNLYDCRKNNKPKTVATIKETVPVQPNSHGNKLNGINKKEYNAI